MRNTVTTSNIKSLEKALPTGVVQTPNGFATLNNQIERVLANKNSPVMRKVKSYAERKCIDLANALDNLIDSIGKAPAPVVINGQTVSKPVMGDFHSDTGTLLASTGYMIRLDGIVVYKRNGKAESASMSPLTIRNISASREMSQKASDTLSRGTKSASYKINVILFSNAEYSTSVSESLGRQRNDGEPFKQGAGWLDSLFYKFQAKYQEIINSGLPT